MSTDDNDRQLELPLYPKKDMFGLDSVTKKAMDGLFEALYSYRVEPQPQSEPRDVLPWDPPPQRIPVRRRPTTTYINTSDPINTYTTTTIETINNNMEWWANRLREDNE